MSTSPQKPHRPSEKAVLAWHLLRNLTRLLPPLKALSAKHPKQFKTSLEWVLRKIRHLESIAHRPQPNGTGHTLSAIELAKMARLVRETRRKRSITRAQLAEMCGLSLGTLRNFETMSHHPTRYTLDTVLRTLQLGRFAPVPSEPNRDSTPPTSR